jgi:uncharacterized membrane protein YtjA (UPF0391 family)
MFGKITLLFLIVVLMAAAVGFGPFPGILPELVVVARIVFFIFLVLFLVSLFDVIGERFRGSP